MNKKIFLIIPILFLSSLSFYYLIFNIELFPRIFKIPIINEVFLSYFSIIFPYLWCFFLLIFVKKNELASFIFLILYLFILLLLSIVTYNFECPECGCIGFITNMTIRNQLLLMLLNTICLMYYYLSANTRSNISHENLN